MKKILLIGQAPPIKPQDIPYDSTMLYDWLKEIGVSKEEAQLIFEFEAMTDKIPKVVKGNQKPPSIFEMKDYYHRVLLDKIYNSDIVILLGKSPMKFFDQDEFFVDIMTGKKRFFTMIHPSKRNITLYRNNKEKVLSIFEKAITEQMKVT